MWDIRDARDFLSIRRSVKPLRARALSIKNLHTILLAWQAGTRKPSHTVDFAPTEYITLARGRRGEAASLGLGEYQTAGDKGNTRHVSSTLNPVDAIISAITRPRSTSGEPYRKTGYTPLSRVTSMQLPFPLRLASSAWTGDSGMETLRRNLLPRLPSREFDSSLSLFPRPSKRNTVDRSPLYFLLHSNRPFRPCSFFCYPGAWGTCSATDNGIMRINDAGVTCLAVNQPRYM